MRKCSAQGGEYVNKPASKNNEIKAKPGHLLNDLRSMIHAAREYVAQAVNSALVLLLEGRQKNTAGYP